MELPVIREGGRKAGRLAYREQSGSVGKLAETLVDSSPIGGIHEKIGHCATSNMLSHYNE